MIQTERVPPILQDGVHFEYGSSKTTLCTLIVGSVAFPGSKREDKYLTLDRDAVTCPACIYHLDNPHLHEPLPV